MSLESALAAARSGDEPGREQLLALTRPRVLHWANGLVSDRGTAEDVAQEALLEVWAKLEDLREPAAFLAWVHLIVRKHADRHRRGRRPLLGFDSVDVIDPADGPLDAAVRKDELALVRRALSLAPDQDQRLLQLKYSAGWPDAALAELLTISPGAVRKRLHDARRRLRPVLSASLERTPQDRRTLVPQRFGQVTDVYEGTLTDLQPVVDLTPLPTGIRVLDGLLPIPRAGLVDLCAPMNTGSMVLLSELVERLGTQGPTALVAACAAEGSLLPMLVEDPSGQPERAAVFRGEAVPALAAAVRLAGDLAREGRTVLLVVDASVADAVGLAALATLPLALAHGAVTVIRCASWARDADPVASWAGAHTQIRLSGQQAALGVFPAVDLLASSSSLTDPVLADQAREQIRRARALDAWVAQPFVTAEPWTGVRGERVTAHESVGQLRAALSS